MRTTPAGTVTHTVYEVGPDMAAPGYVRTNYRKRHKVSPTVFGIPVDTDIDYPHLSGQRELRRVPLTHIHTDQKHVYAPHVRNLATIPAHILETSADDGIPEAIDMGSHVLLTHGNHRVAAAAHRGDTDTLIRVYLPA